MIDTDWPTSDTNWSIRFSPALVSKRDGSSCDAGTKPLSLPTLTITPPLFAICMPPAAARP